MKISEQKQFVRDLVKSVQSEILENTFDMPSDWDGIELRQYIADKFSEQVFEMSGARKRNYKNAVIVTNL